MRRITSSVLFVLVLLCGAFLLGCDSAGNSIFAAPTIASFTPANGPATGGTAITITGTNLTGVTVVTIAGIPTSSFTVVSPTEIIANAPLTPVFPLSGKIVLIAPGGSTVSTAEYTFTAVQ